MRNARVSSNVIILVFICKDINVIKKLHFYPS